MCCGGYYGAMTDEDIVDDGWAVQADTVEELAETIGVPADELTKTIDVWNEIVGRGEGIQFYRLAEDMAPISEPPFYAIKCTPESVNTDSGPVRSARAEILDLDGNPIPHLFSASKFGFIWSNMYQGGGNLAECLIFGRIARVPHLASNSISLQTEVLASLLSNTYYSWGRLLRACPYSFDDEAYIWRPFGHCRPHVKNAPQDKPASPKHGQLPSMPPNPLALFHPEHLEELLLRTHARFGIDVLAVGLHGTAGNV